MKTTYLSKVGASFALSLMASCSTQGESGGSATDPGAKLDVATVPYDFGYVGPAAISNRLYGNDTSFPLQAAMIDDYLANSEQPAMLRRSHGWSIWGALTSSTDIPIQNTSGSVLGSDVLPNFMTWYSSFEIYRVNSSAKLDCSTSQTPTFGEEGIKRCLDKSLLAFNKFSQVEASYVISSGVNELSTLTQRVSVDPQPLDMPPQLSSGFNANTQDNVSFSLKPVYYLLKNDAHNLVPYWGGLQAGTTSKPERPTPNTWNQCVLVTVGSPQGAVPDTCNPGSGNANVPEPSEGWQQVSLEEFMALPLTSQMVDALNNSVNPNPTIQPSSVLPAGLGLDEDTKPQLGDVAVLVGMHIAVRETQDWVWQTMYWSPGNLRDVPMDTYFPELVPGSASGKHGPNFPGSSYDNPFRGTDFPGVPAWAANYAMCTADASVYPAQPRTGGNNAGTFPQICFNPWLETAFDHLPGEFSKTGLNSNCMTCHGQASYNGAVSDDLRTTTCNLSQGFGYYANGYVSRDNACLTDENFDYDFSWHVSNAWYETTEQKKHNPRVLHQKPPEVVLSYSK